MAQGFVKSVNLIESNTGGSDRAILDNLGGPNITSDLLLFDGNTKFTSKLIATDYTVVDNTVYINGSTSQGKVAFSNGTLLSHNGGTYQYKVVNSNAVDRFQLYTPANALFSPTGILRRSDAITGINLANLSVKRLVTDSTTTSGVGNTQGSQDLYNLLSINSQVSYIGGLIGLFYYKRGRVPLTYQDTTFNLPIKFNGAVRITNDAVLSTLLNTTPGLFIIDANVPNSSPTRAFSDESNPWVVASGALQTTETNAQCGVLKLKPTTTTVNINFDSTGNNHTITQTNTIGSYTHKLPVVVNGEQYYLLLKQS
jgi:hypothetical protein